MPRLTGETSAAPATADLGTVTVTTASGESIVGVDYIKTRPTDDRGDNLSHLFDELLYELRRIRLATELTLGDTVEAD